MSLEARGLSRWSRFSPRDHGFAILVTLAALLLHLAIYPYGRSTPFLLFFGAVMLSGWKGGWGPGLLGTGLSALLVDYFFLPPRGSLSLAPQDLTSVVLFAIIATLITWLNVRERSARLEAQAQRERLHSLFTEQVLARRGLEQTEQQLAAITQNATLGLFLVDAHQQCVFMNPAAEKITGFTLEELRGKPLHDFIHHTRPDGTPYPRAECPIERALPTHAQEQGEDMFVRRDGSFYPVAFTASPLLAEGKAAGTVIELRDTTQDKRIQAERERLLAELQEAVRLRDEFLSVASHEMKTPLTPLSLRLQGLERTLAAEPHSPLAQRLGKEVEVMRRQVKRLSDLMNELLDVSRISSGRLKLLLEEVDLAEVTREVAARFGPEAQRFGCALVLDMEGPVTGQWDRLRLEQVLTNLLSNAIKYGAGKPIHLRVERGPERARLVVRDEGIGIQPEALGRIFDRFERAVSERHYGGLGLGLYVTRQIIVAMGGTVGAESLPAQGATFTVELPYRPSKQAGPPERGAPSD